MTPRAVGLAFALVGAAVVVVSALADPLGIGGAGSFGWKQIVGVVVGGLVLFIGLALAKEWTNAAEARSVRAVPLRERVSFWRIAEQVAPFLLAFAVFLGAFLYIRPETAGDEPHYLLAAESLAYDRDIDLRNDYASRDRTLRVVNIFPLDYYNQAATFGKSPQLRPVHPIGLSILLAPAVALGGLTGARIAMVLIAALLADQLYRLLRDLRLRQPYRTAAWLAAMFCLPVLAFSDQIYPELPGALLVVACLRIMVVGASSPAALALGSAAAAALVWLHVRYVALSLAAVVGLAIAACVARWDGAEPSHGGRVVRGVRAVGTTVVGYVVTGIRNWRTVALPVVVPYIVVLGLLAVTFKHFYGSPNPLAPYHAYSSANVGSAGWRSLYDFTLAILLSPSGGWIPFAPVHWLGLAALGCLVYWFGWRAAAFVGAALAYLLLVASGNPGFGWGLPARYPMIVIPLVAIPIALVLQHVRASRFLFVPLLAVSILFAFSAMKDFQGLYPLGDKARMFGLREAAVAYPGHGHMPTSFVLNPGQAPHQTGHIRGQALVAKAGRDGAGYLFWGPYSPLNEGTYRATLRLGITGVADKVPVARIEAVGSLPPRIFAWKVLTAGEIRSHGGKPTLSFKTPGEYLVETRMYYEGLGTLTAGPVNVEAVRFVLTPRPLPAWIVECLWIGGTIVVGWLFVWLMQRSRQRATSDSLNQVERPLAGSA
jgi:hypothetical protein